MKPFLIVLATTLLLVSPCTKADPTHQALYQKLRCIVCQGQSLAESDAPLARDIRAFISQSLQNGHSEDQILQHLVEHYGVYILMKPPLQTNTLLLWAMPFLLLGSGVTLLYTRRIRR